MSKIIQRVTRIRLQFITPLDQDTILMFLKDISSYIPGMKYPDHDKDKKRFKVSTNRGDDWKSEVHVLAGENVVELAWGPDVDESNVIKHVENFGTTVAKHFDEFLIEVFDCNTSVDLPCKVNPYSLFEEMFYNNPLLSAIRDAGQRIAGESLSIFDNDPRFLYGIGESLLLAVNISANASRDEVRKNEYDDTTKVRISAGVAETDPKRLDSSLSSRFVDHVRFSLKIFNDAVFPNTVYKVKDRIVQTKPSTATE